ncbi:MAG: DUF2752 domain-containing protein [Candidatus Kapaibacterium sp.]
MPLEAAIWTSGLLVLALFTPSLQGHATVCIPTLLGFDGCIGCGLGASIGQLFRGHLAASWETHPLGVPATVLLIGRVVHLVRTPFRLSQLPL